MEIKLKDKKFNLKYNNKALFKIEKETGIGIIQLFQDESKLQQISILFTVVWAGIQDEISFDEFSNIADASEVMELLPSIVKEIGAVFDSGGKKK